jgi:Ca2+-binding RTX toxin-like protein
MPSVTMADGLVDGANFGVALDYFVDWLFDRDVPPPTVREYIEVQWLVPATHTAGQLALSALPANDSFSDVPEGEYPLEAVGALVLSGPGLSVTVFGLNLTFAQLFDMTRASFMTMLTAGPTSFDGSDGADTFEGRAGHDTLYGGAGNDTLVGSLGNDGLNGDAGRDRLMGGDGRDVLFGGLGNDSLTGDGWSDLLHGGDGYDTLRGGPGNDSLAGAFGADLLTGGAGADDFLYRTLPAFNPRESGAGGRDTITDFRPGTDDIDIGFIRTDPFDFLGRAPLTGGGQVRYRWEGRDSIVDVSTDDDAGWSCRSA